MAAHRSVVRNENGANILIGFGILKKRCFHNGNVEALGMIEQL
jgi:hypothetical protein